MDPGRSLYRLSLRLLPQRLRRRAAVEMLEVFEARRDAADGVVERLGAVAWEIGGVVRTAWSARLPQRRNEMVRTRRRPVETFLQDVRYAVRAARRRPGPTVLAVLTFALGIAASTAMFSVVDAVLLRPLPFPEPDRIVSVYTSNPQWADHPTMSVFADRGSLSFPEFRMLREQGQGLDGLAVLSSGGEVLYDGGEPERIPVGRTTADLFSKVLRVTPLYGRVFDDEDVRSGERVTVLSEGFWQRRFGGDPSVVGTTMRFGDDPVTILGILPESAQLAGYAVDAWTLLPDTDENWGNHWLYAIGRLSDDYGEAQAETRLAPLFASAAEQHDHGVNLVIRQADETRNVRGPLMLLSAAAIVLLLVACGNVAALLIGAAIDRQQELSVRAALGAGRGRLVGQLLTESVALAAIAAVVGVLLTSIATRGLVLLAPGGVPRIAGASVDPRALLFAIGVSLLCGIVFGLIPALGFSRADLRRSMNAATRGSTGSRGRVQAAVVVGELAQATVLLVGGGLLARTVLALNATDPGFAADETLGIRLAIPFSRILADAETDQDRFAGADAYYRQVMDAIATVPGIRAVGMTSNLPLSPDRGNNGVIADGIDEEVIAERRFVSAGFFELMGIEIVEGRGFDANDDRPDAPVRVVISEGLARRLWPDTSPIGRRFGYWGREGEVIGVARDIRDEEMRTGTTFSFYAARRQADQLGGSFVARVDGDPRATLPALRQRLHELNPAIAIVSARPLSDLIRDEVAAERYRARLILVFSALAGIFALMGIYGVTARNVSARTRELGIRKALGARRTGILGLVLGQAVRMAALGALLGVAISFVATRAIESYLWGVPRTDPLTLVAIAGLLGAASVVAALAPGRRASRIEPVEALRVE